VALLSVSGACSRSGKTALAVTLLRALPAGAHPAAVKFTTTDDVFERCPRGTPCVVCDIDVPFRIVEDAPTLRQRDTDTDRLAAAGAERVVWAISKSAAVAPAWTAVQRRISGFDMVVMEGSTIVNTAKPDFRCFVVHPHLAPERWKPGSGELMAQAELLVVNRPSAEPREPSGAVLAAIAEHRDMKDVVVADVLRPLAEWAPAACAWLLSVGAPA
jgi:hypothetical protein